MCNEELKIHQKKEERQRVFTCLYGKNIDRMEERKATIYGKKKMGRRRVKIKGIWRDGRIVWLRYRVVGR